MEAAGETVRLATPELRVGMAALQAVPAQAQGETAARVAMAEVVAQEQAVPAGQASASSTCNPPGRWQPMPSRSALDSLAPAEALGLAPRARAGMDSMAHAWRSTRDNIPISETEKIAPRQSLST